MERHFIVLFTVILGIFSGLGFYTLWYAKGFSYLSNDPRACANCHVMQATFDSWAKSSHQHVATCNDCHVPEHPLMKWITKAENGFHHSLAFTFYEVPLMIRPRLASRKIAADNCVRCHETLVNHIQSKTTSASHGCLHCHYDAGHSHPSI